MNTSLTANQTKSTSDSLSWGKRSSSEQRSVLDKHESEAKGYCRKFKAVFESATGSIMRDSDGNEYIDFLASCGALNYGHNDPDMGDALISQSTDSQPRSPHRCQG